MRSNLPGGAHSDVLRAKPETEEEKAALVAEIKERAKKAFARKEMPTCEALYFKAIEVAPEASTYANRSAVRLAMGRPTEAKDDATRAVELDAAYAKAYYRLGQACEKIFHFDEAIDAYAVGASLEPESKLWPAYREKAEKAKVDYESRPPAPAPAPATIERYEISSRLKASLASSSSGSGGKKDATAAPGGKTTEFRGYKLDSQGRKTTFFNNELDEETKQLIGDIAPRKVDADVAMRVADGASAWNQSGTFEETNHTAYAKKWFREELVKMMVDLPPVKVGDVDVQQYLTIDKVTDFRGDASTAMARGKKKYVVDVAFTLAWKFATNKSGTASGTAFFPDVTGDAVQGDDGPLECQVTVDSNTPQHARAVVDSHVKSESVGLRPEVLALAKRFLVEFRQAK
mmetsp:Transcript_6781/g.21830  ORF Transcript_6781/g.21830 Transcript_6781/m.21830 type:complete len:403 (+) Transcript_6781:22-1230(+)